MAAIRSCVVAWRRLGTIVPTCGAHFHRPQIAQCLGSQFALRYVAAAAPEKTAPKPRKSAQKNKDPDRPILPMTTWIRFLADFRKQNPGMKNIETMQSASAKWKSLPAEQKRPYEERYEADLKQYKASAAEYVSSGKKDAWKRDPERPKLPMTAYLRFLADFRKRPLGLRMTEQAKQASVDWKALGAAQKAPYEQAHAAEKAQYQEAMKRYKASGKEEAWKQKVGLSTAAAKEKKVAKEPEKPKKPASAYVRFSKDYRESNNLTGVEGTKQAAAAWKELSEEKKAPYSEAYAADKSKYEKQLKRYNKKMGMEDTKAAPKKAGKQATPKKATSKKATSKK